MTFNNFNLITAKENNDMYLYQEKIIGEYQKIENEIIYLCLLVNLACKHITRTTQEGGSLFLMAHCQQSG